MPRGQYQRKTSAAKAGAVAAPTVDDPSASDNVLHPVDDNPAACPPPLCPEDFPGGWPEGAEQSAGCAHGMWIRQWPPVAVSSEPASSATPATGDTDTSTDGAA